MRWGADAGGALPAAAGAGTAPAPEPLRRTTRTTSRPRPRAAWRTATSASSCASSATSTTTSTPIEDTAVEWTERVVAAGAGRRAHHPAAATSARSTRWRRRRVIDDARLQPVEHHRRVPAARQPQPGPQGRLRRERGAPPGLPLARRSRRCATRSPARLRARRSRSSTGTSSGTGCRVRSACSTSRRSATCCASENLIDTEPREAPPPARPVPPAPPDEDARARAPSTARYNDLSAPAMGAVGATFGRNLRPHYRPDLFDEPNPVVVSQQLLHREQFLPARSLNLLAAAWIQFQVHDWVDHARHPLGEDDVDGAAARWHDLVEHARRRARRREMRIAGNMALRRRPAERWRPAVRQRASHWWDGSEVYGADAEPRPAQLRRGREAPARRPTATCPTDVNGHGDHRLQRELVARA